MPAPPHPDRRPAPGRAASALRSLVRAARTRRWDAVRAATAIGLPLVIGLAAGHVAEGGQAALGSFVAVYAADAPYRRRAWLLAVIAVALTVAMALGSLVAGSVVATCLVGGALAAASALGFLALRVGPPREYFVILTFLLGTTLPVDASATPSRAGLVLAGAALAWLVAMAPWALRRPGPEGAAARRAHGAVVELLAAIGTPRAEAAGHDAIVAVRGALDVTDGATSPAGLRWSRRVLAAELVLEAALALEVEGSAALDPAWPTALRALAHGRTDVAVPDAPALPAGPRLAAAAEAVRDAWAPEASPAVGPELDPRWRAPLGWSLRRGSPHRRVAARMGLAVLAGLVVGHALGLNHPSWVAASAAAVLQGSSLTVARNRAVHRAVGTAVGVVVAAAIFALDPSDAVTIALIVALQLAIEALIVASYGLAVVAITPLVLLLISVSGGGPTVDRLLGARLVDTLVGCAVAAATVLATRPRHPLGHLPDAQAEAIRAAAAVLVPLSDPGSDRAASLAGRRRVHEAIVRLRGAEADALGDALRRDPREDARWPLSSTVDRLARLALTVPADRVPRSADRAAALAAALDAYADRTAGRARPAAGEPDRATADGGRAAAGRPSGVADLPAPPPLPGLPRTTRTLAELHRRLAELEDGTTGPRRGAGRTSRTAAAAPDVLA